MSVFTIFFCGTGSNNWDANYNKNYHAGELISKLATNHEGKEFVDWIVVDGPGSGNLLEDEKWTQPGNYADFRGKAFGAGWEENVAHAIAVIKGKYEWSRKNMTKEEYEILKKAKVEVPDAKNIGWIRNIYEYPNRKTTPQELQAKKAEIFRNGKLPSVVNIIGWSRGGVTCHMLANAMAKDPSLKKIPVNIFAVDPVPGSGQFRDDRIKLAANVKEYFAVYAHDERSIGFAPVIPELDKMIKATVLPIRGRHATVVGNAAIDGGDGNDELFAPGKIVRDLAEKCLTNWGTPLKEKLSLSKSDIATAYNEIVRDASKYDAMQSVVYTKNQNTEGERSVSKGSRWAKYSDIKGEEYIHPEGLIVVKNKRSWYHEENSDN